VPSNRRRKPSALSCAVVALFAGALIAGCGGSSHKATSAPASTSTPGAGNTGLDPAFRKRANLVCTRIQEAFRKLPPFPYPSFDPTHPDVSKLPAIARYFASGSLPLSQSAGRALRALGQPARGQSAWQQFISVQQAKVVTFEHQVASARRSDATAFTATVYQFGPQAMQQGNLARALGLPACAMI
jgi:hypothetical protein